MTSKSFKLKFSVLNFKGRPVFKEARLTALFVFRLLSGGLPLKTGVQDDS